jgi:hypothetical protein
MSAYDFGNIAKQLSILYVNGYITAEISFNENESCINADMSYPNILYAINKFPPDIKTYDWNVALKFDSNYKPISAILSNNDTRIELIYKSFSNDLISEIPQSIFK